MVLRNGKNRNAIRRFPGWPRHTQGSIRHFYIRNCPGNERSQSFVFSSARQKNTVAAEAEPVIRGLQLLRAGVGKDDSLTRRQPARRINSLYRKEPTSTLRQSKNESAVLDTARRLSHASRIHLSLGALVSLVLFSFVLHVYSATTGGTRHTARSETIS